MRAVVVRAFGGPQALEIVDVPIPEPGTGQVRIRVEAAAVNPVDAATRAGHLTEAGLIVPREMYGIGWDVAGVVDETGPAVHRFSPGDKVIGLSDRLDVSLGTYADYVVLDAGAVAPAPAGLPAAAAATLPLNALTAVQALDRLALDPGRTLLVTGGAGGLGGFAIELAARRGLRVVASASDRDAGVVRAFGAEWFVPRSADLATEVRRLVPGGVDAALDAAVVGVRALDAVRGGGAFLAFVSGAEPPALRGTTVGNVWIRADGARLAELAALAAAGHLTPRVADVLPLTEAADAHERLAKGGLSGRLVLAP
ncbi:MAG TPA: NADP-dependent oxidoreductase [Streptosporangiaceae bacterium]|jgi:NADPH:quinone reductase-like Zn-dependent oxidoreductase